MANSREPEELGRKLRRGEIRVLKKQVSARRMRRYIREFAGIPSRHVLHSGNEYAVELLHDELGQILGESNVSKLPFDLGDESRARTVCNVEAILGQHDKPGVVIVSAHLDSTAEGDPAYHPLIDAAPGADDDATGIAGVLLAARAIYRLADKFKDVKRREIRFVLFNAEEAKQLGSRRYVEELETQGAVRGVFQMDMIGHGSRHDIYEIHAGYEEENGENAPSTELQNNSRDLAEYVRRLVPEVAAGLKTEIFPESDERDPAQGFSDHTSFHRVGIPACLISENFFGPPGGTGLGEPNPAHHLPEDMPGKLDFIYAAQIARVVTTAAWYLATRDTLPRPLPAVTGEHETPPSAPANGHHDDAGS